MVRSDWRLEHRASSLAICRSGGAENQTREELDGGGMGRYRSQDCSIDPDYEVKDLDSHAMESGCLDGETELVSEK